MSGVESTVSLYHTARGVTCSRARSTRRSARSVGARALWLQGEVCSKGEACTKSTYPWRTEARWRRANLAQLALAITHYLAVNSARNAVVKLVVEFGENILVVDRGVSDISHRRKLHNIPHHKLL